MNKQFITGMLITLLMFSILSFSYMNYGFGMDYDEVKSFWWLFITMVTTVALFTNTKNMAFIITGSIIIDMLFSSIFLFVMEEYLDSVFILIHHFIWAYLLFYISSSKSEKMIFYTLIGQLNISSLDFVINMFKLAKNINVNIKKIDIQPYLYKINLYGRLLLGNYSIIYVDTNYYHYAAFLFNCCIGTTLANTDNIFQYYH